VRGHYVIIIISVRCDYTARRNATPQMDFLRSRQKKSPIINSFLEYINPCILNDFHYKTSRTGVSPVLKGEMTGQPGRLSYRGLGAFANKNRSI
jgi:hypothetical protein